MWNAGEKNSMVWRNDPLDDGLDAQRYGKLGNGGQKRTAVIQNLDSKNANIDGAFPAGPSQNGVVDLEIAHRSCQLERALFNIRVRKASDTGPDDSLHPTSKRMMAMPASAPPIIRNNPRNTRAVILCLSAPPMSKCVVFRYVLDCPNSPLSQ